MVTFVTVSSNGIGGERCSILISSLLKKKVNYWLFLHFQLSHLSPLHGTIYMNLKCVMEANVEEKGFLVSVLAQSVTASHCNSLIKKSCVC